MAPLLAQLDAHARKLARILAPIEASRLRLIPEEERLREKGQKTEQRYWLKVAEDLRAGKLGKLYESLHACGAQALAQSPVHKVLEEFRLDLLVDTDEAKRSRAKGILEKICPPLATLDPGRPVELTEKQRQQNKRQSTLQATQDRRASAYCGRLWTIYQERTARFPSEDVKTRERVAAAITKESPRGGPAKQESVRLFLEQVKQDVATRRARTVRKNSR